MSEITTIARPYAKAIFDLAIQQKQLKEWSVTLKKLAMIAADKQMQPLMIDPSVTKQQLSSIFIDILGSSLMEEGKNLINELTNRKRLSILPAISEVFESCLAEHERTLEVKVVSAFHIDEARLQKLQRALGHKLNRQIQMRCIIDSKLIGGIIIYAGDEVIDGSLRGKLDKLSKRLYS